MLYLLLRTSFRHLDALLPSRLIKTPIALLFLVPIGQLGILAGVGVLSTGSCVRSVIGLALSRSHIVYAV